MRSLVLDAADRAAGYLESLPDRRAFPDAAGLAGLRGFDAPLPDGPTDPHEVLAELDRLGTPATAASAGGRYFGFVNGGSVPAAVAANILAAAWDQNAGLVACSPVAAALERVAMRWILEILGLPAGAGAGFTTGATTASFAAIAAARHALLARAGWDVEADGLFGAPPIDVVVSDEVHVAVLKALGLAGLGRGRVRRVPTDAQGRMRGDRLPPLGERSLVCVQAGNVNTGAFDPIEAVCDAAERSGAWVHVDGAFGLWAAAVPARRGLVRGVERAHSWATDGHKWLNVPYDSGIVLVREAGALRAAHDAIAAYLVSAGEREPCRWVPEGSRRARGIEIWAALRSLGRSGLADLVERNCRQAARFAEGLRAAGHEVLNDVVLNQVLVAFGGDDATRRVVAAVQDDGTCWCGGTTWQGRAAMRISVSCWATTDDDVERSLAAMLEAAGRVRGR